MSLPHSSNTRCCLFLSQWQASFLLAALPLRMACCLCVEKRNFDPEKKLHYDPIISDCCRCCFFSAVNVVVLLFALCLISSSAAISPHILDRNVTNKVLSSEKSSISLLRVSTVKQGRNQKRKVAAAAAEQVQLTLVQGSRRDRVTEWRPESGEHQHRPQPQPSAAQ